MFNKELIDEIRTKMMGRKETIAVAESVTSGFLQAALSSAKDAAQFYQGGITAYNIGQKYRHLLVDPIHAAACNCVSPQVASQMATNVCNLFQSQWGIGVCGYAAPAPESNNQMFAYYAIAYKGEITVADKLVPDTAEGPDTQVFFVNRILKQLDQYLDSTAIKIV